jgi:hypothetical protein
MPSVTYSYPGVYLIEAPPAATPGVVAAPTSRTAFIGPYLRGPADQAVLVNSWRDFSDQFGGLDASSLASYAVWQFFVNGGSSAWIVRTVAPGSKPATATLAGLTLAAKNPGAWANAYYVSLATSKLGTGRVDVALTIGNAKGAQVAEMLTALPGTTVADLADAITTASNYLAAKPATPQAATSQAGEQGQGGQQGGEGQGGGQGGQPSAPATGTAAPSLENSPVSAALSGGDDGNWTDQHPPTGSTAAPGGLLASAIEAQVGGTATSDQPAGLLDRIAPDVFNIMCLPDLAWLPEDAQASAYAAALTYCESKQAFLIIDPPPPIAASSAPGSPSYGGPTVDTVGTSSGALTALTSTWGGTFLNAANFVGAVYYPWVEIGDPANGFRPRLVPPSGTVAGIYARTDAGRGVWKAPAGVEAVLQGVTRLGDQTIDDAMNGELNVRGVNCLRAFPGWGNVVWGARTLAGGDLLESPWKYVPARRLADFIEQSLTQSLRWVVFEPNGPSLWSTITLEVGVFMSSLYAQGAFTGATAAVAYQVACDATTTSLVDIEAGVVNIQVGFMPAMPAEFVVLTIRLNAAAPAS